MILEVSEIRDLILIKHLLATGANHCLARRETWDWLGKKPESSAGGEL